jgi:hypothetical protein
VFISLDDDIRNEVNELTSIRKTLNMKKRTNSTITQLIMGQEVTSTENISMIIDSTGSMASTMTSARNDTIEPSYKRVKENQYPEFLMKDYERNQSRGNNFIMRIMRK